jgi:hypothetical protein
VHDTYPSSEAITLLSESGWQEIDETIFANNMLLSFNDDGSIDGTAFGITLHQVTTSVHDLSDIAIREIVPMFKQGFTFEEGSRLLRINNTIHLEDDQYILDKSYKHPSSTQKIEVSLVEGSIVLTPLEDEYLSEDDEIYRIVTNEKYYTFVSLEALQAFYKKGSEHFIASGGDFEAYQYVEYGYQFDENGSLSYSKIYTQRTLENVVTCYLDDNESKVIHASHNTPLNTSSEENGFFINEVGQECFYTIASKEKEIVKEIPEIKGHFEIRMKNESTLLVIKPNRFNHGTFHEFDPYFFTLYENSVRSGKILEKEIIETSKDPLFFSSKKEVMNDSAMGSIKQDIDSKWLGGKGYSYINELPSNLECSVYSDSEKLYFDFITTATGDCAPNPPFFENTY